MLVIDLERGGAAELCRLEGDRATVQCGGAAAPGSRLAFRVAGRTLRLKVHRCVREGERFTIDGRFIDLTRDLRDRLAAGLAAGSPAAPEPEDESPAAPD